MMIRRPLPWSRRAWRSMTRVASSRPIRYSAVRVAQFSNREIVGWEARGASHRVTPQQQLVDGVVGEMLRVVTVGMAAGDGEDPLAEQVRHHVPDLAGFARVDQTANEPGHSPYSLSAALSSTAPPSELVCG